MGVLVSRNRKKYDPQADAIPMPYAQLLPRLLEVQLIKICALGPLPTSISLDVDANAWRVSHSGAPGR